MEVVLNHNNQQINTSAKIIIVGILILCVFNLTLDQKKFKVSGGIEQYQSQIKIDELNQYVTDNFSQGSTYIYSDYSRLKNVSGTFYNFHFFTGLVSPDWQWVAFLNKDSFVEITSIQNPSIQLSIPQHEKIRNLLSWSPDSRSFLATIYSGPEPQPSYEKNAANKIILFTLTKDNEVQKHELDMHSIVPYGEPFIRNNINPISWSPDGKFIAAIANANRSIVIMNNQAKFLQTIYTQVESLSQDGIAENLYWVEKGLIYSYAAYSDSQSYKLMFLNPDEPKQQFEMIEVEGIPTFLGSNETYLLIMVNPSFQNFKLLLFNYHTYQVEKTYNIPSEILEPTSGNASSTPYSVFVTKNSGFKDNLWIYDWDTMNLKKFYIEDYMSVIGWNQVLDGIGVFVEKNKDIQLWVVKPL